MIDDATARAPNAYVLAVRRGANATPDDPPEDAMAYPGSVPVEKFLEGISRFQKDVYPQHQDLFEKLAMGQRPEALFITCADSRIVPCQLTQTGRAVHLPRDWQCGTALS